MRRIAAGLAIAAACLMGGGLLAGGPQQALAYGNSGDAQQVYQLEFSGNCNNADLCGGELGGFWGWAVLYDDGTGEAEIAFCSHGDEFTGAGHQDIDFTWEKDNGFIVVTSEVDTNTGHGPPTTETIASEYDVVAPTAAGHYSTSDLFGLLLGPPPAPGVAFQIQVVALPVS
jgi:hypothetical protein